METDDGAIDISYDEARQALLQLEGKPVLTLDGRPGNGFISKNTARQYVDTLRIVANDIGCENGPSMRHCFGINYKNVIAAIEKRYPRANQYETRKTRFSNIRAILKYVPNLSDAIGLEARTAYYDHMMMYSNTSNNKRIERTDHETVPDIDDLEKFLKENIADKDSDDFLSAILQIKLQGIRNELGSVRILTKNGDKQSNWYNKNTGVLAIHDFKTKKFFEPYKFTLPAELQRLVSSLASRRKKGKNMLVSTQDNSAHVKKTFKKLKLPGYEVTANLIRRAQISKLLQNNMTAAQLQRNAKIFKHNVSTDVEYARIIQSLFND